MNHDKLLEDLLELRNHIQAGRLFTALEYINKLIERVAAIKKS